MSFNCDDAMTVGIAAWSAAILFALLTDGAKGYGFESKSRLKIFIFNVSSLVMQTLNSHFYIFTQHALSLPYILCDVNE